VILTKISCLFVVANSPTCSKYSEPHKGIGQRLERLDETESGIGFVLEAGIVIDTKLQHCLEQSRQWIHPPPVGERKGTFTPSILTGLTGCLKLRDQTLSAQSCFVYVHHSPLPGLISVVHFGRIWFYARRARF